MMNAGEYYVGDLCYVLHDEWDEVCGLLFAGRNDHGCNQGEFNLKDGRRFAIYNTRYGDGRYYDQNGGQYDVDAGSIGCILLSDIDLTNIDNFVTGGEVIKFDRDFSTFNDEGRIVIGNRAIDTAESDYDSYEEDEEYYEED